MHTHFSRTPFLKLTFTALVRFIVMQPDKFLRRAETTHSYQWTHFSVSAPWCPNWLRDSSWWLTSHTTDFSCWAKRLVNCTVTLNVKVFSGIELDFGLKLSSRKRTERSEQTEGERGLACNRQRRQMAVERQKQGDERKEDRRAFPGGCLASNTILPKVDEEMKWAPPSLPSNAINSL